MLPALLLGLVAAVAPTPAIPAEPTSFALPQGEPRRLAPAELDVRRARFTPGNGLQLTSKDQRFSLGVGLRFGVIYELKHTDADGISNNLAIRRMRAVFTGNLFGKHNRYLIQLGFAPRELDLHDGAPHSSPLLDAALHFDHLRDLNLRVGQRRVMYSHERNVSDVNPLLVDRSLANSEFNLDRDIGVELNSFDLGGLDRFRYYAGVYLGEGRDSVKLGDAGFLYVARLELTPFGAFDDLESSDLWRRRKFRMLVGGAYAYHDRAWRDRGTLGNAMQDGGSTNYHNATTDLTLKYAGWSFEGGYLWRRGRRNPGAAVDAMGNPIPTQAARNGHGWFLQTAILIPRTRLEPAVRYSGVRGLGDTSLQDRDELGGGLNYYFFGHNLKLQLDYFRGFTPADPTLASDTLRLQIQANI